MNCEQYRQAITADPHFDQGNEHLATCAACRAVRAGIEVLDRQIGRALTIDVPELVMPDLPQIDAGKLTVLPIRRGLRTPTWLAIAATVVLAAMIGVRMFVNDVEYRSLADEIVAHLDHEPYALRVTDTPVSETRLRSVVPTKLADLDHGAGVITYAQTCVLNGHRVPHLVIQGARGPITVLLLPDEKLNAAVEFGGESINGVLLPVGEGSIAIIGERDEQLEPIKERLVSSLKWGV